MSIASSAKVTEFPLDFLRLTVNDVVDRLAAELVNVSLVSPAPVELLISGAKATTAWLLLRLATALDSSSTSYPTTALDWAASAAEAASAAALTRASFSSLEDAAEGFFRLVDFRLRDCRNDLSRDFVLFFLQKTA